MSEKAFLFTPDFNFSKQIARFGMCVAMTKGT